MGVITDYVWHRFRSKNSHHNLLKIWQTRYSGKQNWLLHCMPLWTVSFVNTTWESTYTVHKKVILCENLCKSWWILAWVFTLGPLIGLWPRALNQNKNLSKWGGSFEHVCCIALYSDIRADAGLILIHVSVTDCTWYSGPRSGGPLDFVAHWSLSVSLLKSWV